MPAVKLLHQESDSNTKPKYIMGHSCQVVAILAGALKRSFGDPDAIKSALNIIMRVGDRISFAADGGQLWKRFDEPDFAFIRQIAALAEDAPPGSRFAADNQVTPARASNVDSLAVLAFALHRARNRYPLLYLGEKQLAATGETVYRAESDGPLTIVAQSSSDISVAGVTFRSAGDLHIGEAVTGVGPIKLNWAKTPKRVLVVSDQNSLAWSPPAVRLKRSEKRIVDLGSAGKIAHVSRFTRRPTGNWIREVFEAGGPMAGRIDLSRDEVGPHDLAGEYIRLWIVRYESSGELSQRQLHLDYSVGPEAAKLGTGRFLRP